jgi:N-acyl-D-amino-acid deacylase
VERSSRRNFGSPPIIISGGLVVDGSGSEGVRRDIAILGDRVVPIDSVSAEAAERIDAMGKIVCPGFIDVHSHDDGVVISDPAMLPKISQGVTTVVTGNCGLSLAPFTGQDIPPPLSTLGQIGDFRFATFAEYIAHVKSVRPAVNVAPLVGHGTLRVSCVADLERPATTEEIDRMRAMLGEALESGAFGFSTGLYYPSSAAATPAEVIALASEVAEYGAVYAAHIRDEGERIFEALDEAFHIRKQINAKLIVSHHKCAHPAIWGQAASTLAHIDKGGCGLEISLDVYPYDASSTILLEKAAAASKRVVIAWSSAMPSAAGRDLDEVAAELGTDRAGAIAALRPGGAIYFRMDEDDVRTILAHPKAMIGSDGLPADPHPHPRLWGTFPRVLGKYVREESLLPMPEAIRKMTALPAEVFGLVERGRVNDGYFADIVVFDPETVADAATYASPCNPSIGIDLVLVNGQRVYADGRPVGARPGRVLSLQGTDTAQAALA